MSAYDLLDALSDDMKPFIAAMNNVGDAMQGLGNVMKEKEEEYRKEVERDKEQRQAARDNGVEDALYDGWL